MQSIGIFSFSILFLWACYGFYRLYQKRVEARERIKDLFREDYSNGLSLNPKDYLAHPRGKDRSNPLERKFRRRYLFDLYETFENKCAGCKSDGIKFQLDHFFIPKSRGGNFLVKHQSGYWVCNGIPLCKKCNQRKKDLPAHEYFEPEDLEKLREKIGELSKIINGFS